MKYPHYGILRRSSQKFFSQKVEANMNWGLELGLLFSGWMGVQNGREGKNGRKGLHICMCIRSVWVGGLLF